MQDPVLSTEKSVEKLSRGMNESKIRCTKARGAHETSREDTYQAANTG